MALSLVNSRNNAYNTGCAIGFHLANYWSPTAKISAINTNANGNSSTSTDLVFNTHDGSLTEKMRISANGNVGIGTNNPSFKLDVNGSLNCTSLNVDGSVFTAVSNLWSTTSPSISTSDIFYNDNNAITGTGYSPGSIVTITGSISDNNIGTTSAHKMGLIVQHSNRTQGLGIGYNGISQCGYTADLNLYLKAKGTGTTQIGSSGGISLYVSDSKVGIGTSNPSYKLDVYGDINCTGNFKINGSVITQYGDSDVTQLLNNGITTGLKITSGNVGIGTSNPQSLLDVNGEIKCSSFKLIEVPITATSEKKLTFTTGGIYNTTMEANGDLRVSGDITAFYSDERLKHKTYNITNVLSILDNINVFKYENNDLANNLGFKNKKSQIGLSAQEINKYYPELVELAPFDSEYNIETNKNISKSGENYLTLKYDRLVPILLQGIKELHSKNIKLENDIELLKTKVGL